MRRFAAVFGSILSCSALLLPMISWSQQELGSRKDHRDASSGQIPGLTVPVQPQKLDPPSQNFRDSSYKVSFHIPAGWDFERKDGVLSNYRAETRSSHARSEIRGVAAMNFNPWPSSTFSGAIFYYSVIPHADAAICAGQASGGHVHAQPDAQISGHSFHHGRDTHGVACTEARDEVFTALERGACVRFDLVVNTFCAQTSGAMEISPLQLKDIDSRLAGILGSVHLDWK